MHDVERRAFLRGAGIGALAFTVAGVEMLLTPGEARAQGVPYRLLKADEAEVIEALGETLVPGAQRAGVAHFIDHQLAVPADEALLQARIFNVRPPFVNFYRAAVAAVDRGSEKVYGRKFARLSMQEQRELVNQMRQNRIEGWSGPAGAFVYALLRTDAFDVVYGTMEGYAALGIPYQAHIAPERRW
ncbi:MAG: gluconate 2-dehydrogenase subunit 3 family protein [Hyphomicrobiales bacterium]|nr:gluconate 2-dehydrogenase subunit 3 family protein [Hyphomicrobiales bacterium]